MRAPDLFSKEWCNLVFEGRNKDYGAYAIRSRAGKRYRRSLLAVVLVLALWVAFQVGYMLIKRNAIEAGLKAAEEALANMKRTKVKDAYELKFVSTGRRPVAAHQLKGESAAVPEITEETTELKSFGYDVPALTEEDLDQIVLPEELANPLQQDTLAPVVGKPFVPTEVVTQMPQFPGGPKAFMKWLDENIPYPRRCLKAHIGGEVVASFIVLPSGKTVDYEIEKSAHSDLAAVVLMALRRMPGWQPGRDEQGLPTPVRVTVPVNFEP